MSVTVSPGPILGTGTEWRGRWYHNYCYDGSRPSQLYFVW